MDELIYFKISNIKDSFFKEFLCIFYGNAEEIVVSKKEIRKNFETYQKSIIFLSMINKKMNFRKVDFWKELYINKHQTIDKLAYFTDDQLDSLNDTEFEIFIENLFSLQDALLLKTIFIEGIPLKEIAIRFNVSPQAISKRKIKLEKKLKVELEEAANG